MKKIQDNEYIRVTQLLEAFSNFSNIPKDMVEAASERGSAVHDLCNLYALDSLIEPIPEKIKGYFESFKNWFDDHVERVIQTEERLDHSELFFTGKYDLLCTLKDDPTKIVLIDYKTSATPSKTWQLQSAAYSILIEDQKDMIVDRRLVLMLQKDGSSASVIEYTEHAKDCALFLKAFDLFLFFNF